MGNWPTNPTVGGDAGNWGTIINQILTELKTRFPDVTGADNTKVLQVSGGAWSLQPQASVTGFIISSTEPVGAADGTVWIQP